MATEEAIPWSVNTWGSRNEVRTKALTPPHSANQQLYLPVDSYERREMSLQPGEVQFRAVWACVSYTRQMGSMPWIADQVLDYPDRWRKDGRHITHWSSSSRNESIKSLKVRHQRVRCPPGAGCTHPSVCRPAPTRSTGSVLITGSIYHRP